MGLGSKLRDMFGVTSGKGRMYNPFDPKSIMKADKKAEKDKKKGRGNVTKGDEGKGTDEAKGEEAEGEASHVPDEGKGKERAVDEVQGRFLQHLFPRVCESHADGNDSTPDSVPINQHQQDTEQQEKSNETLQGQGSQLGAAVENLAPKVAPTMVGITNKTMYPMSDAGPSTGTNPQTFQTGRSSLVAHGGLRRRAPNDPFRDPSPSPKAGGSHRRRQVGN